MSNKNETPTTDNLLFVEGIEDYVCKPYRKPILEELGDLRALTLGGSPGCGDSGGGFGVENLPGNPPLC